MRWPPTGSARRELVRFELLRPVPAVTIAAELKRIPLFRFASVDELFRISTIARQVRHETGATIQEAGSRTDYIQVLVEGKVRVEDPDGAREQGPPAIFGFQTALEGSRLDQSVVAIEESICLAWSAEDFRNLISDNIDLAEGLFQMLLGESDDDGKPSLSKATVRREVVQQAARPQNPGTASIEKGWVLQEVPLFSRATPGDLLDLAGIVREVGLREGELVIREGELPAMLILLSGEIALEPPEGGDRIVAGAGDIIGVTETLAGRRFGWRGTVTREGRALQIERGDLFELLSDHLDLLQGLFGSILHAGDRQGTAAQERA